MEKEDELITKVLEYFYRRRDAPKGITYESISASVIKYSDPKYGDVKRKIIEYEQLLDEVNLSSDPYQHYRINKKGIEIIEQFKSYLFYKKYKLFDQMVTDEYRFVSIIFDEIQFDKKHLEQFVNNLNVKTKYDFIHSDFGDPNYRVRLKQKKVNTIIHHIDNSKHTHGDKSPITEGGATINYGIGKESSFKKIAIGIIIGIAVLIIGYTSKEIYKRISTQQQQEKIQVDSLQNHH